TIRVSNPTPTSSGARAPAGRRRPAICPPASDPDASLARLVFVPARSYITRMEIADPPAPIPAQDLYHEPFRRYRALAFWSTRELPAPTVSQVLAAADALKRHGGASGFRLGERLEAACHAAH